MNIRNGKKKLRIFIINLWWYLIPMQNMTLKLFQTINYYWENGAIRWLITNLWIVLDMQNTIHSFDSFWFLFFLICTNDRIPLLMIYHCGELSSRNEKPFYLYCLIANFVQVTYLKFHLQQCFLLCFIFLYCLHRRLL